MATGRANCAASWLTPETASCGEVTVTVWGGGGEARRPARLTRGAAERGPSEEGGRGAVGSWGTGVGETKEGDGDDGIFLWESSNFFCSNWVSALMRLCTMADIASC